MIGPPFPDDVGLREYYRDRNTGRVWEIVEEDTEWYSDTVSRGIVTLVDIADRSIYRHDYRDLMTNDDSVWEEVNEMEAIAWVAATSE